MPTKTKPSIVAKSGGWAQFLVKWVIAAVGAILIAVGTVSLVKTIYKSSLPKYPVESFKYESPRVTPEGKEVIAVLSEEEKKLQAERQTEARVLAQINDYALSAGQLFAGLGLWYVFRLIARKEG